jgi:MurNAc alpha-1-phosphate uridylyltransferase
MILAAGFGTRMGPLTQDRPKPMVPVGGRPMIDHALELVNSAGRFDIVVNAHYFADQICAHLADQSNVRCLVEQPQILDTGGGLRNAVPAVGTGPVITLNPDALWLGSNPVSKILQAWNPDRMDGLMAMVPVENTQAYTGDGDFFLDEGGHAVRRGSAPKAPYVFGGLSILKTSGLETIEEDVFGISLLWDQMLARQRLCGVVIDGGWIDLGHPAGVETADALLSGGPHV